MNEFVDLSLECEEQIKTEKEIEEKSLELITILSSAKSKIESDSDVGMEICIAVERQLPVDRKLDSETDIEYLDRLIEAERTKLGE
jgi:hypothetical protein